MAVLYAHTTHGKRIAKSGLWVLIWMIWLTYKVIYFKWATISHEAY